ncbi:MAG: SGNH/GDSL hydrolase family protein [Myxococcota bacterium]
MRRATRALRDRLEALARTPCPSAPRPLRELGLALAATLGLAAPAAGFTDVYVFGDSLSDSGHTQSNFDALPGGTCGAAGVYPNPPYVGGACSNGPTWVETLASGLGLAAEPATSGGTNYAVGGATAASDALGTVLGDPDGETEDIGDQFDRFDGDFVSADPDALYVILAGANDLQYTARGWIPDVGQDTAQDAVDAVMQTALDLSALGASHFLFANVWDLGTIPDATLTPGQRSDATDLTDDFNAKLATAVAGFSAGTAYFLDLDAVVDGILADPGAHGITDTTGSCVVLGTFGAATDLANPCAASPALQDQKFYFDEIHPGRVVHGAVAAAALQAVPEPATGLLLLLGLGALHRRRR